MKSSSKFISKSLQGPRKSVMVHLGALVFLKFKGKLFAVLSLWVEMANNSWKTSVYFLLPCEYVSGKCEKYSFQLIIAPTLSACSLSIYIIHFVQQM